MSHYNAAYVPLSHSQNTSSSPFTIIWMTITKMIIELRGRTTIPPVSSQTPTVEIATDRKQHLGQLSSKGRKVSASPAVKSFPFRGDQDM